MGFYGSVYYQLINTFYKIIAKNEGKNITTFTDVPDDLLVTEAIGRKGVINLDSGNRWITFSKGGTDGPIKIWHNDPNSNATQNFVGIKQQDYEVKDAENFLLDNDKTYIQLTDHDFLQTYETKIDEAGHTLPPTEVIYRLPKAEVNDKVDRLEELVGTSDGRDFPEMSGEGNDNLYGYVEKNMNDISTLSADIGQWPNPDNYSITNVIGNIKDLLGVSYLSPTTFKSLAQVIGPMKELWEKYDANLTDQKYSLVQIILDFKKKYDTYINQTANPQLIDLRNDVNDINTTIGNKWADALSIYTYLRQLLDKDAELEQDITEITGITNTLDSELNSAESRLDTIENTTIPAITNRIDTHEQNWNGTQVALEQVDSELRADLGTKTGTNDAFTAIGVNAEAIKANAGAIETINNKIGEVSSDKSLAAQIDGINASLSECIKSSELKNYVTTQELDNKDYALNSSVADINTKIEENFTALGYPKEFDKAENTTLLQSIFDQLLQLNTDIAAIKGKMNELHSENPPFPPQDEGVVTE